MPTMPHLPLPGDARGMPAIGLGTWQLPDCGPLVASALKAGYRHIDTARAYGTEQGVGEGIRASNVARAELFVTTKVWHDRLGENDFARSVDESLAALQLDHVDLLLVHWPTTQQVPLAETMRALAAAKRAGLARHVGVANFNARMLEEAIGLCTEPIAVLQAEYHPALDQATLLSACRKNGVRFTAYCPLGRGRIFSDAMLATLASAKRRTVAQVVLRWLVQQGVAAVPRSSNPARIAENFDVCDFELTPAEMASIAALRRPDGRIVDPPFGPEWD